VGTRTKYEHLEMSEMKLTCFSFHFYNERGMSQYHVRVVW